LFALYLFFQRAALAKLHDDHIDQFARRGEIDHRRDDNIRDFRRDRKHGVHIAFSGLEDGEENGCENHAQRRAVRQKRHRDPIEALGRHAADPHVGQIAAVIGEARKTCEAAGKHHGEDCVLPHADAAVFRGIAVVAHRLHLVAERGAVENENHECCRDDRQNDRQIQVGSSGYLGQKLRLEGSRRCDRLGLRADGGGAEMIGDRNVDDPVGDPVHHDAGDDLVYIELRAQKAGHARPDHAAENRGQKHDEEQQGARRIDRQRQNRRRKAAHQHLSRCSDVEKSRLEGERHGQARKHQRNRIAQGIPQAGQGGQSAHKQIGKSEKRIVPAGQHEQRAYEKAEHNGDDGD